LRRDNFIIDEHLMGGNGRFEYRNLNIGSYTIRIHAEGFVDQEATAILSRNNSKEILQFELQPLRRAASKASSSAVSVFELQVPESARHSYEQGLKALEKEGCRKAAPFFEKAIAAYREFAAAQNEMGKCHAEASRAGPAEESFRIAIQYGTTIFPYINLADFYANQNRAEEADALLFEGISKYPDEGDLRFALAKGLFDRGRLKEAEAAALEAHARFHRSADVHLLLAKIYLAAQNFPALVAQLKLYLAEKPKGPMADRVRQNLAEIEEKP